MTTTYNVSSEGATFGNNVTTTLNGAIRTIDTGPVDNYVINITAGFSLTTDLLAINLPAGSTLTINGGNFTLDGGSAQRGLFVYSGQVTVDNLTLNHMAALGGSGEQGAGGGAGLGGGLFVATAGVVTLDNVTFTNDKATGGAGGTGSHYAGVNDASYVPGAGGGMGGNGARGGHGLGSVGGGGGLGLGANGGGPGIAGQPGIVPGAAAGGAGAEGFGAAGGAGGGGGGGATSSGGGGGGVGGQFGGPGGHSSGGGGGGGFGGGGGQGESFGAGGAGGFGGGGGAASEGAGGGGGFGGGGASAFYGNAGAGGFGGGNAGHQGGTTGSGHVSFGGGGGGLGAGGDVFVQQGGSLTIEGGSLSGGSVTKGTGGATGGGGGASTAGSDGAAYGSGIFINGTQTITFKPGSGQTLTISDVITDQSANGGTGGNIGHGAVTVDGGGTVVLGSNDTYTGGTTIKGATTLELTNSGVAGSTTGTGSTNTITFATGQTGTLQIDSTTMPSNTIDKFDTGDVIDLHGIAFVSGAAATYNSVSHVLTVVSGANTKTLTLTNPTSTTFTAVSDGVGGTPGTKVAIGAPNTAPVLDNSKTPVLSAENEDAGAPSGAVGTLISSLVDFTTPAGGLDNVTDPDSGAAIGIALTGLDTTNGSWFYSINGGTTWLAVGAVSDASARLLAADANTRLYFQPNADFNATVTNAITFHAWDQTSGSNGASGVNTSPNGGTTAFSTATDTANLTINAVNDAPVLNAAATPVLSAENEDAGAPSGAVGTLVSALVSLSGGVNNVTDVDSGAITGIALTGLDTTNGSWFYSINGGTTWLAVGAVSGSSARLLAADANTRLYFQPNADFNGTVTNAITFHAWDQTSGSNGASGVNTSPNGGTTAFSTATDTANLTINAVNDAPVVDLNGGAAGTGTTLNYAANQVATAIAPPGIVTDVDSADFNGGTLTVAFTANGAAEDQLTIQNQGVAAGQIGVSGSNVTFGGTTIGTFTGGTNGSNLIITFNSASATPAAAQALAEHILYFDNSGSPSTLARTLTFTLVDGDGTANSGADTGTATATINVTVPTDDFTSDGKSDLLWQNTDGSAAIWQMNGNLPITGSVVSPNPGPSWHLKAALDFTGDGKPDLLWQNDNGDEAVWTMNGLSATTETVGPHPGSTWHVIGANNFTGDSTPDILWQNDSGAVAVWTMSGDTPITGVALAANPGPSWHLIGAADFTADTQPDLMLQNTDGSIAIWTMNGVTPVSGTVITPNPGAAWHLKGAVDFTGDGKPDLLLQNDDGSAAIWTMNGITPVSETTISPNPGTSWHLKGASDFTGDGQPDLLWQNNDGSAAIWTMNGITPVTETTITPNPGSTWHLIPQNIDETFATGYQAQGPAGGSALQDDSVPMPVRMFDPGPQADSVPGSVRMLDPGPQGDETPTPVRMFDPGPASDGVLAPVSMFDPGPRQETVPAVSMFDPGPQADSSTPVPVRMFDPEPKLDSVGGSSLFRGG